MILKQKDSGWQPWFAWHPVTTLAGERIWLEWAERWYNGRFDPFTYTYKRWGAQIPISGKEL